MNFIDLNCDMGELPEAIVDGTQDALMASITSVNIACGGHAGDQDTMKATIEQALRWQLAIGAHPGYPDRANFGRIELSLSSETIAKSVFEQLKTLDEVAIECRTNLTHVKPHGALYNQAARDSKIAEAIARGVAEWGGQVVMVGLAGSVMLDVFKQAGFAVAAEAFADRRYERDGSLRSRRFDDALLCDPAEAAQQAINIVQRSVAVTSEGDEVVVNAQTLCIHSDTPGAPKIAIAVMQGLKQRGITVRALCRSSQ